MIKTNALPQSPACNLEEYAFQQKFSEVSIGLCEEMGFQPSPKLSTTDGWWAKMWWKCVPDGWGCNMETPSTKLCSCRRDKHVMAFMCQLLYIRVSVTFLQAVRVHRKVSQKQRRSNCTLSSRIHAAESFSEFLRLNLPGRSELSAPLQYQHKGWLRIFWHACNWALAVRGNQSRLSLFVRRFCVHKCLLINYCYNV